MPRPRVAVVAYRLLPGRVSGWKSGSVAVPDAYLVALRRAGLDATVLPPGSVSDPGAVLETVGGLLLIGGGDIDPARFEAEPHERVYGVDAERDELELELARHAVGREVPVLAICRGAQVVNVALGGTLIQHLPDLPGAAIHGDPTAGTGAFHDVKVAESSHLFEATGRSVLTCWSHHHQGLDRLGAGLVPVGWSGDGLVEAVEREDGWLLAVQWHPEETAGRDPTQQALFDEFSDRVRARAG